MTKLVAFDLKAYKASKHYQKILTSKDLAEGDEGWLNRVLLKFATKTKGQLYDNRKWAEKVLLWVADERRYSDPTPPSSLKSQFKKSVVKNSTWRTPEQLEDEFKKADAKAPSAEKAKDYFRQMREAVEKGRLKSLNPIQD